MHVHPALALALSALLLAGHAAAQPPLQVNEGEAIAHRLGPSPVLRMPWQDLSLKERGGAWFFRLTVDEQGRVTRVVPHVTRPGPEDYRPQAQELARALRFKPFERDGQAMAVEFDQPIAGEVEDYTGPAHRNFPAGVNPMDVSIALWRTSCYGSCPAYRLELRGDGLVTYRGDAFVVAQGTYQWRVAPAVVAALAEQFRKADYFRLKGAYIASVTDLPSYTTRLSLGAQRKYVVDYGGLGNTDEGLPPERREKGRAYMPRAVVDLEDAIDAAAGSASWVKGDATTVAKLRAANFDFGSEAVVRALYTLASNCRLGPATDLIREATPVNPQVAQYGPLHSPEIAASCGDLALLRLQESRGAFDRPAGARNLLESGVHAGYPELVAMALKHGASAKAPAGDGLPLLAVAAGAWPDRRGTNGARFDPVQVIAQLLKAGANVQARDRQGRTALFTARSPDVVAALVRAGIDPNATDNAGNTALESTYDQAVAKALLAAGARLPTHPTRLESLKSMAAQYSWTELQPVLERATTQARR